MKKCDVEGCKELVGRKQYCRYHYHKFWKQGLIKTRTQVLEERGRYQDHPLYKRWSKVKKEEVCDEWKKDFWKFVDDVGEPPQKAKKLFRLDYSKPMGPGNWKWSEPMEGERKNAYYRERRKNNPLYLGPRFLKNYGITYEEYMDMYNRQNGKCAICKQEERRVIQNGRDHDKRMLSVDHCHITGKVRGLLCSDCNPSLGGFKDNIEILQNAIDYLKKHQTT